MEPIDLGGHVGQEQLQLGEEGEVVGGDVGMWAAADIVLYEPVGVQGAQDTQHVQVRLRVENIVDDTLTGEEGVYLSQIVQTISNMLPIKIVIALWEFSYACKFHEAFLNTLKLPLCTYSAVLHNYLEVKGVVGVRHQAILVGAL